MINLSLQTQAEIEATEGESYYALSIFCWLDKDVDRDEWFQAVAGLGVELFHKYKMHLLDVPQDQLVGFDLMFHQESEEAAWEAFEFVKRKLRLHPLRWTAILRYRTDMWDSWESWYEDKDLEEWNSGEDPPYVPDIPEME